MAEQKFSEKVTINSHLASRAGHRFEKPPKRRNLPTMNQTKIMNQTKTMLSDADESNSDELITQIKNGAVLA